MGSPFVLDRVCDAMPLCVLLLDNRSWMAACWSRVSRLLSRLLGFMCPTRHIGLLWRSHHTILEEQLHCRLHNIIDSSTIWTQQDWAAARSHLVNLYGSSD
jgi:hypothetical protein